MAHGGHHHRHSHGHSHDHSHGQHHAYSQAVLDRIRWAFWLNLVFAVIELLGGIWTNSVAILSDAIHDFGDAFAIGTALYLEKKSQSKSDQNFSYGYRRFSTASALITGLVLIFGAVWILLESIPRLIHPEATRVDGMIGFAIFGVLINGFGMIRMSVGKSLNERVITWHLLEDLLGWIVVLGGAVVMKFFDLPIVDPILGILLSAWVLWNVGKTLKEAMKIFLQATPLGVEIAKIEEFLKTFKSVESCHHTHIWSMDGDTHILTTHLVVSPLLKVEEHQGLKNQIKTQLHEKFKIAEATIEIELSGEGCLDPAHS